MKFSIVILLLISLNSCAQQSDSSQYWKSSHRNLKIQYGSPWILMPALDIKSQTLVGVIDNQDGKSYIIQYFDDVPQENLSTNQYLAGVKKTMLEANPKNKILAKDSLLFHGHTAHAQTFLMHTIKWGMLKQISYVIRTGTELITVQICFPTNEPDAQKERIPEQLVLFDKMVKINGF